MMTRPIEWAAACTAVALLIPAVRWVLGPAGRRDGVLFTGGYLVAVFGVGGLWDVLRDGPRHSAGLVSALFFAWALRGRWRAARSPTV